MFSLQLTNTGDDFIAREYRDDDGDRGRAQAKRASRANDERLHGAQDQTACRERRHDPAVKEYEPRTRSTPVTAPGERRKQLDGVGSSANRRIGQR